MSLMDDAVGGTETKPASLSAALNTTHIGRMDTREHLFPIAPVGLARSCESIRDTIRVSADTPSSVCHIMRYTKLAGCERECK
jgi:hypothetical protein